MTKSPFAGEKKPSMKRRDDHNDYSGRRMYMITIETKGRRPLLGCLRGRLDAPAGSPEAPHVELSPLGRAVSSEWMGIPRYYPQIEVMGLQVMPDHLHGILFVHEALPLHLGHVIGGFKTGCNRLWRAMLNASPSPTAAPAAQPLATQNEPAAAGQQPATAAPAAQPLATRNQPAATGQQPATAGQQPAGEGSVVRKYAVAVPQQKAFTPLFASNYNDLLLKSYDEFKRWKHYLADNPRRLMARRARPDLLRPFFGLRIGSYTYNGIGNRALLSSRQRLSVRISRRLTGEQLQREAHRYLAQARQGAVLVSPAISPGEKAVMRTAFDASLPIIVILPNGFTPLSKPGGERFDACAQGRLLLLSAWEHQNERKPLTARQCQQMNLMAIELCQTT